jgi:putative ABC transport system permease protein
MFFRLFKEGFYFAVNSVVVNKLRTFLSLFGITIGIFSIISVFTAFDWMAGSVRTSISTLGDNVIYVQKWPWSFGNFAWWDVMKWPAVSMDDYRSVLNKSTKTEIVGFDASQGVPMKYKKNVASGVYVSGITPEFKDLRTLEIEKGRYFSPFEFSSGKNVIVLGYTIAEKLFDKTDPIGKEVTVKGFKTTVIGVTKKEGNGALGESMDDKGLIPLNFSKSFINFRNRFADTEVMIKAKPGVSVQELTEEITMILRAARRLHPGEKDNFSINQATLLTQGFEAFFAGMNIGGWLIGGFSILVGGFGIANIMFVSVRERTNQIGIQKALGAKKFFILQQFLVESFLLSVLGGILGIIMVFIGTIVINYLYDLNMYLTLGNILLAIFISGIIGIVAGYAPAASAAKMNPVDAIGFSF